MMASLDREKPRARALQAAIFLVTLLLSTSFSLAKVNLDVGNGVPARPPVNSSPAKLEQREVDVPIIIYHLVEPLDNEGRVEKSLKVTPEVFAEQMNYLAKNGYQTLDFDALYRNLNGLQPLPEKAVILTFDDGWASQIRYAVPILVKHEFKATFFVVTDYVEHHNFLSWQELRNLKALGMSIGSHSRTHPDLVKITNQEILALEVLGSKQVLEREGVGPVNVFAYPYGFYNQQVITAVRSAGYYLARSVNRGVHNSPADQFKLNVVIAPDNLSVFEHEVARNRGD